MNIQILEVHNADIVYSAAVTCIQHFCTRTMEILATSKHINKINMNGIENLSLDLAYMENYIKNTLRDTYPRTYSALNELRQFVKLVKGNTKDILDDNIYRTEYSALQMHKLQMIMKKFTDKSKRKYFKK